MGSSTRGRANLSTTARPSSSHTSCWKWPASPVWDTTDVGPLRYPCLLPLGVDAPQAQGVSDTLYGDHVSGGSHFDLLFMVNPMDLGKSLHHLCFQPLVYFLFVPEIRHVVLHPL